MTLLKQLGDHITRPSQDFLNSPGEADKFMRWLIPDQTEQELQRITHNNLTLSIFGQKGSDC